MALMNFAISAFAGIALAFGATGFAQAQEACATYLVQDGDTLGSISMAAYGRLDYQLIFNANADALRGGSSAVKPGTELNIPCEDGRLTKTAAVAPIEPVVAPTGSSGGASGKYLPTIRIATGGDWYPFADEGLSGGGFLIRLTSTAFVRSVTD